MTDPLSVAASIADLLTAAEKTSSAISKVIKSHKTGKKDIIEVKRIVNSFRSLFTQLQLLLLRRTAIDPDRTSMILVEEIVTTLTACVMTFSDLHGYVKGLESDESLGLLDGIRWAARTSEVKGHLQSLEAHKTSLTLIMTILPW